jgi:acyl-CoA synthetase (NDP forming)
VLVGTGGIFAEVLEDVAMRLPPFDDAEARRMIAALRGAKLLDGARGRGPVDRAALANILVRLGDFAAANADLVAEMDINPLVAAGGRLVAVDALIVLRGPSSET